MCTNPRNETVRKADEADCPGINKFFMRKMYKIFRLVPRTTHRKGVHSQPGHRDWNDNSYGYDKGVDLWHWNRYYWVSFSLSTRQWLFAIPWKFAVSLSRTTLMQSTATPPRPSSCGMTSSGRGCSTRLPSLSTWEQRSASRRMQRNLVSFLRYKYFTHVESCGTEIWRTFIVGASHETATIRSVSFSWWPWIWYLWDNKSSRINNLA